MERQIDCFLKGVSVLSIWKFSVQGWCQYTDYCVCFENMGDSHKSSLGHGHQNRGHVVQVLWRDLMMGWGWKTGRFSKWQHGRTSPSPHMEACFSKWALAHEFLCSFFVCLWGAWKFSGGKVHLNGNLCFTRSEVWILELRVIRYLHPWAIVPFRTLQHVAKLNSAAIFDDVWCISSCKFEGMAHHFQIH